MPKFSKKQPTKAELDALGVEEWGVWTKEVSQFPWEYDEMETFYVLEGKAKITSDNESVEFGKGDLVTCQAGVKCVWQVFERIKKHYHFGQL